MRIVYDEKLQEYMRKKGYSYIAVESVSATGCCADLSEISTRFVRDKDAPALKEKGCGVLQAPIGEVLIITKGLEYDEEVSFSLKSFLGAKDIAIKGIRAWKF